MKLKIEIQNCYGIGSLNHEVDYSRNNIAVIYAPNGTMKTSLKKTIEQLLAGKEPCDEFYKDRVSSAAITIDGVAVDKVNTYVFQNEDADGTKQISTFLANANLKGEYEAIYQLLDGAKKALKKKVKQIAKSSDCEEGMMNGKTEIRSHGSTDFGNYGTELRWIYECLELRNTHCVELRID